MTKFTLVRFLLGAALLTVLLFGSVAQAQTCCGLTPGYWKTHTTEWVGYSPTQSLSSVFGPTVPSSLNVTLLQALSFSGGSGVDGALQILFRSAVAGLLNGSLPTYHFSAALIIDDVQQLIASQDRDLILKIAAEFNAANQDCVVPIS